MITVLYDLALVKHQDHIGVANGAQAMGDDDLSACQLSNILFYHSLRVHMLPSSHAPFTPALQTVPDSDLILQSEQTIEVHSPPGMGK